jgi:regulatory protein
LRKRYGAARIRQELARRGAAPAAIAAAMAAMAASAGGARDAELERARAAATAWSRKGGGKAAALARHLERRGFASDLVFRVLRERFPDGFDAD